jgi:hypothetical protein
VPSDVEVIRAIEHNLTGMQACEFWTIGLARNPYAREAEIDYPAFWRHWETDTPEQAASVKSYFLHKGMRDDGSHGDSPLAVYLF